MSKILFWIQKKNKCGFIKRFEYHLITIWNQYKFYQLIEMLTIKIKYSSPFKCTEWTKQKFLLHNNPSWNDFIKSRGYCNCTLGHFQSLWPCAYASYSNLLPFYILCLDAVLRPIYSFLRNVEKFQRTRRDISWEIGDTS